MAKGSPGSQFLKNKYQLSETPEVQKVMRVLSIHQKELAQTLKTMNKEEIIDLYLKGYEDLLSIKDEGIKNMKLEKLKKRIYDAAIIKELPEAYWNLQKKIVRE